MELSDAIHKLQSGDEASEEAFEYLVEEFKNRIFTVCYRMLSQYDDAKEIAQDTFIEVYLKIKNLQDSRKFPGWIYRIAVNKCLNFLKKQNTFSSGNVQSFGSYKENPDNEKQDSINFLLSKLPDKYKIVLILFYIEDRTVGEIAGILNISESAVKMRLKRGRDNLKRYEESLK